MSKVLVDQIEKRTGGTAMNVPASGRWAATSVGDGTVSDAEFTYINSLSSNAQTQLDAKAVLTTAQTFTACLLYTSPSPRDS